MNRHDMLRALAIVAGTACAYAIAGLLALQVAIPPSYASPIYPASGIALAAALVYGRIAVPGALLGAFIVNASLNAQRGTPSLAEVAVPALIALGAALQAGLGAALVRRFARAPRSITEPRDVAVLLGLGALLACLVSSSIATLALSLGDALPAQDRLVTWFTWYSGDALGTLIAAPIALTLIGQPREDWHARRLPVGLTLTLVTLLMGLGIWQVARVDEARLRDAFERNADTVASVLRSRLLGPLHALEAMRGAYVASDAVTREEFGIASRAWLDDGAISAIGWYERVRYADLSAFEAAARAEGQAGYRVFDREDGAGLPGEILAMRYIEPAAPNAAALGLNAWSVPAVREAIERSAQLDRAVASAPFPLTQVPPDQDRTGVVVYRAIHRGPPAEATRERHLRGAVFVTLRPGPFLQSLTRELPAALRVCVMDVDGATSLRRLAGPVGCEGVVPAGLLSYERPFPFADRQWRVRVTADPRGLAEARGANAWLFSLIGLLGAAMLGALLLVVTGRTRRIEAAVRERTAALQSEVHERERAQAALRDSEQRFRNILNHVPIGVIYTDLRGNVKQTNPRFCELTGYSDDELLTMTVAQFTHVDDQAEDVVQSRALVQGEFPMYRRHKRYVRKDGRIVWVQSTVSLLRDETGRPRRIVGVVEDITEHLRLLEAEKARDRAEAANRAKSDFLSRMSHELRTPLNAMLGFAQLLDLDKRQPLAPEQRPWVAQIQQAGWHLLEMINEVLDLSRIESGNVKLLIEPVNLAELLAASIAMVDADAKRRGITISSTLADGTGVLLGDPTRVKQILVNLLSNAVKYNREGGRIHIGTRLAEGPVVEIAVTDTGLGMTETQLADLFQPFNRLGREESGQEGTGIGLVISQRLAELMGGSLRARSSAGEGSSFILGLPAAHEPDTVPSDLDGLDRAAPGYHRRIVHYVEDNETNVEVMRGILAQRPQVQMEVSVDGAQALAAIRRSLPDLVLLDMHLPDLPGEELLRRLKADSATEGIPVVVVSADATAAQIDAALQAGASLYLTKPVSVSELLAAVDDVLERTETRFG
ncbi:CHASE domain-containing protein [Piscinibacter defluvii]|uniref:CHASE domain-containing protein n=1 Tax=Piscinibacter defluvii TaxID=1796922 RepID=UPI000FDE8635|nr:CHASE domain-containing protein [Piscinibacter defluvii]